jgi:hypothetical protein
MIMFRYNVQASVNYEYYVQVRPKLWCPHGVTAQQTNIDIFNDVGAWSLWISVYHSKTLKRGE